jgi:hypothetical protein
MEEERKGQLLAYNGKRMARMGQSRLAGIFSESRAQLQLQKEVALNLGPAVKLPLGPGKKIAQWKSLPSLTASTLVDFVAHPFRSSLSW